MNDSPQKSNGATAKLVVALVLLAAALILVFSNTGDVALRFLMIQLSMPGWVWLIVLLGVGVIIGSLFPWFRKKK